MTPLVLKEEQLKGLSFQPMETADQMGHYMSRQIQYEGKRFQIYYKPFNGLHEFGVFQIPIIHWLNTKWRPGNEDQPIAISIFRQDIFPENMHDFIWMNMKALMDNMFKALKEKDKFLKKKESDERSNGE